MDLLNGLLSGKGGENGMLGTLLPLLLGNKKGNLDLSSLLSAFGRKDSVAQGTAKGQEFPPLFDAEEPARSSFGDIMPLIQTVMEQGKTQPLSSQTTDRGTSDGYPYELQYNHPDKH